MTSSDDDSMSKEESTHSDDGPPTPKKGKKTAAAKGKSTAAKKKRRHKPKDFPKRPLSAYNIFFKETREKILKSNEGKSEIPFQTMAKEIAARWKDLDPEEKERVDSLAQADMKRYREEVKKYEEEMVKRSRKEREDAENLRRQQESEKAEDENHARETAKAAKGHAGDLGALGGILGGASLEQQLANGGLELDAVRREQIQMRLIEELRAVEARALQVRQLQAQLGLPTGTGSEAGGGGGYGAELMARQNNSYLSAFGGRDAALNEYEVLLRQRAAASLYPGVGGLGLPGLLQGGGMGLGLGGLGGAINPGIMAQLQGLGGFQGMGGASEYGADIQSLLQNHQEMLGRGGSGNPPA